MHKQEFLHAPESEISDERRLVAKKTLYLLPVPLVLVVTIVIKISFCWDGPTVKTIPKSSRSAYSDLCVSSGYFRVVKSTSIFTSFLRASK